MDEEESAVESGKVKIRKMPRRGCTQRSTTGGKAPSQEKIKDAPADEGVDSRKMSDSHSSPVEEFTDRRRSTRNRTPAKLVQVVVSDPTPRKKSAKTSPRTRKQQVARQNQESDQQWLSEEQSHIDLPLVSQQVILQDKGSNQQELSEKRSHQQVVQQEPEVDKQELPEERSQVNLRRSRRQIALQAQESNQQQSSEECSRPNLRRSRRQVTLKEHGSDEEHLSEEQSQLDLPQTRRQIAQQGHGSNEEQLCDEQSKLDPSRTRRQIARQDHGSNQQELSEEQSQSDLPRTRRQIARQSHELDQQQLPEEQSQLDIPRTRRQIARTGHGSDQQQSTEEQSQLDLPRTRRQIVRKGQESDQQQLPEERSQLALPRTRRQIVRKGHGSDQQQLSEEQSQVDFPRQQIVLQDHESDQNLSPEEESQLDRPRTRQRAVIKEKGQGSDQKQLSEERSQMDRPRTRQKFVKKKQGTDEQESSDERSQFDLPLAHNVPQKQRSDQQELSEEQSKLDQLKVIVQKQRSNKQKAIGQKQGSNQQQVIQQEQGSNQQQVIQQEQRSDQQRLPKDGSQSDHPCMPQQIVLQEQGLNQQQLPKNSSQLDHQSTHQKADLHVHESDRQQASEERTQEQSATTKNDGKETGAEAENREQITKLENREESKDMQDIHPAGQNATVDTDQFLDPAVSSSSLAQGLNGSDGDAQLMKPSAGDNQSSSEEHTSLAKESCDAAGKPIGNQLQHENDAKEIKNADNSQRLQPETSATDNQVSMLPTAPITRKPRCNMGNTGTPERQFLNPDASVQQTLGDFSFKFPYPCQMKTDFTDNKEGPCPSTPPRMKQCKMKHSQGNFLMEPSHLKGHSLTEPSHLQGHSVKEPPRLQGHSVEEPSHLQGHSVEEPSHLQGHSVEEPSRLQGHSVEEPSHLQGHSVEEPSHLQGHSVKEPSRLQEHSLTDTSRLQGHSVNEPSCLQEHSLTDASRLQEHSVKEPSHLQRHSVEEPSHLQGHSVGEPSHLRGHSVEEPSHLQGHSVGEPSHLQGHSVEEPSHLQGHSVGEPSHLRGHSVGEPSHLRGHSVREPSHLRGHSAGEPSHLRGHSVGEPSHLRGHSVGEPSHLQGHSVGEPSHLQGHSVGEPSHLQGHSVKEPSRLQEHSLTDTSRLQGHSVKEPSRLQEHSLTDASRLQEHSVKEPSHLQGHSVEEPSHLQGHSVKEPNHLQGHLVEEPSHLQRHSVEEPNHLQGHSVEEPNHLQGHSVEEPSHLQGHSVEKPNHLQGHSVEEPSHLQGHSVEEPSHLRGHSVEEPSHLRGHSVEEPSHLRGHSVEEPSHLRGHSVEEPSHLQGHSVKEPLYLQGHSLAESSRLQGHSLMDPSHLQGHSLTEPSHLQKNLIKELSHLQGHSVKEPFHLPESSRLQGHLVKEPSHLQGHSLTGPSHFQALPLTGPCDLQGHPLTETFHLQGHSVKEPSHLQGHLVKEPSHLQGHLVKEPSYLQGHLVKEPSHLQGHLVKEPSHLQAHLVKEPSHLQAHLVKEPSHLQAHLVKEPSHLQAHLVKEPSHLQAHLVKEPSHLQAHSVKEPSHLQRHQLTEPSHLQVLSRLHENHIDYRSQSVFTDHSMQKESGNSAVFSGTVSGESSYGMRQIFSGSEQKHNEGLDLSYPDAHLISAGHNRAIEKVAHVDEPSSNNATLGPTNMKQARKSDKNAASGRSLNKTDGIAPTQMNLLDHNLFDYETKHQFFDQSSVLNKSNPSPFPTSWPPVGEKPMPTSTSHPLLPQNMSLSSPVPIVCSYSGEMSSSERGAKKQDEISYPNDAHSAPPPLETCSNESKSMRSPSVPVFTRPETKSKFCCDECTRSGGVSEKCSNMNSKFYLKRCADGNARSNFGQVAHPHPQKPIQSAFASAQNIPYNDNHSFKKSFCSPDRSASTCCASSTLASTSYKPSASVTKNDPSSQSFFSRNIAKTTCSGSSSPCLPPQHAHFMHPKDTHYMHKAPTFYQAPSVLNASNRASHNNNLTYANSIHTSYSNNNNNNNLTIQKPLISLGNNKADKTVRCAPSEEATNFQPPGYPPVSTSHESHQLTHICSAPNMVTPSYTSSIYTSSSNTATYISSTQSSQSQIRTDSTSGRYAKPPNFPAPPSYAEVIRQKNSIPKNHDLLASQNISKKLLWQPFSEEKPMIHIKNEVITGTYPGEVPTSSQMPSSQTSSSQTPSSSSIPFDLSVFNEPHPNRQPSASTGHPNLNPNPNPNLNPNLNPLRQAVQTKYNTLHPMHPPETRNPMTTKMKVDAKPRLGENGTSVPSGYKQRKVPQRDVPPPLHDDSKQVPSWTPKVEQNPTDMKNDIKCTFKIKNSEFSDANFQNAFLNSFPKNTNIPLDKINRISNALNETTKRIFNNNHPESSPAPPHEADGRKTPDRKPTFIKSEPQLGPYANGSTTEPEPDPGSDPDDLFTRLKANKKMEIPLCGCLGPEYVPNETVEGPYYTHLGTGSSKAEIQKMMEERTGLTGKAVRVESIIYSGKEGKSTQGCPIAKWIVRRPGVEEKILCLVRQRRGHFCPTACIVICIVAWEGVPRSVADDMYSYLVPTLTQYGLETDRRCGYNEQKTCACQGVDMKKRGASFSFGCSWSMYFNGCKFARSREAKRFRLKDQSLDEGAEGKFQNLATRLAPLYKSIAPESYQNQVFFEDKGYECRLGHRIENDEKPCRPFSGVTACVDFCAHAHKDLHNMNNGCTVVVTLTKHGPLERPKEEQLHVLPLYILDVTQEALEEKIKSGGVEILANYPKVARIRATPFIPKRKLKKSKKDGVKINNKKENKLKAKVASQVAKNSAPVLSDKFLKAAKNISGFNSKNNNLANKVNLFQNASEKNPQLASSKEEVVTTASSSDNALANKLPESEKQPPLPAKANMYNEFWKYFYSYGTFPPANFLNDVNSAETMRFFATHLPDGKPIFPPPLEQSAAAQLLQHPAADLRKDVPANVIARPGSAGSIPLGNPGIKDLKSPFSVSSLTADDFESPLHLLSEAVMIRSQTSLEKPRPAASHPQVGTSMSTPRKPGPNSELSSSMKVPAGKGGVGLVAGNSLHPQLANQALPNANVPVELSQDQHSRFSSIGPQFVQKNIFDTTKSCQPQSSHKESSSQAPFTGENVSRADCPDGCMRDIGPEVIRAELEYNEQNFYDPDIGGVAIALTHGSVLFEVAKRELHATTALLNPNRFSPTRISLVFYQHKSMNLRHHGWYENERKLELQRQKRLQKLQEEAEKNQPIDSSELKPGSKKRRKKDEPPPPAVLKFSGQYTPMWPTAIKHTITQTTNSIITQWIDPQPTVSGPYQKWI